ncbi:MAG: capsular biosynthesis protein [Hyphomicrobium sp.]|nr:capsular biosynthesis protein [Hyphomicrobium sp.]
MIDLHCHILPGVDDGPQTLAEALEMARMFVRDGVTTVACTSHILPGLYPNHGCDLRSRVGDLQAKIDQEGIPLRLVTGADNHIVPDMVRSLREGHLLPIADSRYVLVEPPHHVAPRGLDVLFFSLTVAGYVPILTHPERLSWLNERYASIETWVRAGVWMQVTAGSLAGVFGRGAQYWAEHILDDGLAHVLATDAHDTKIRAPDLRRGRDLAAARLGDLEARYLVTDRPGGVIENAAPSELPAPPASCATIPNLATSAQIKSDHRGSPLSRISRRVRSLID